MINTKAFESPPMTPNRPPEKKNVPAKRILLYVFSSSVPLSSLEGTRVFTAYAVPINETPTRKMTNMKMMLIAPRLQIIL